MSAKTLKRAQTAIEERGILLVYPMTNRERPASLWSALYPDEPMRWAWDEDADERVVDLWHLRARLATSSKVVYTKWYRGRATFFSRPVFVAMLATLVRAARDSRKLLERTVGPDATDVLTLLEDDSPRSTKELRRAVDLVGRPFESRWSRALGELWARLLIVGVGEVQDGAFPSLAVGATKVLFEDLWDEAHAAEPPDDGAMWRAFGEEPLYRRLFEQTKKSLVPG